MESSLATRNSWHSLPSEQKERQVLVALPIDWRDWFGAGPNLSQFLSWYFDHAGDKFWERRSI